MRAREATYVSVFDEAVVCASPCLYEPESGRVFAIEPAENAEEADSADALTDEYVAVDGRELREADGVWFDY